MSSIVKNATRVANCLVFGLAAACAPTGNAFPSSSPGTDDPGEPDRLPEDPFATLESEGEERSLHFPVYADSALVAALMSPDLRPMRLRHVARFDKAAAAYLRAHPDRSGWLVTELEFAIEDGVRGFRPDGRPARIRSVHWWAPVVPDTALDARIPPGEWLVQLAAWVEPPADRSHFLRRAETARIAADQGGSGTWRVHLDAPDLRLQATCDVSGPRRPTQQEHSPFHATIWEGGRAADVFFVFAVAFHGFAVPCDARWSAEGTHPLAIALRTLDSDRLAASGAAIATVTNRTRAGAYRRAFADTVVHSVTARFALAEVLDNGTQTEHSDGSVTISDQANRLSASGDIVGQITTRFTERVDRAAGTACNSGAVESGRLTLVATGEEITDVAGTTQACVSGFPDRTTLDSASITLRAWCVTIELRGEEQRIVNQSTAVAGTWTTCRSQDREPGPLPARGRQQPHVESHARVR